MKVGGMIIILGGMLLLASCSFQFQTRKPLAEGDEAVWGELATTHTVVKGETLWKIAGYPHIYGDPYKWKRIYNANRDVLAGPDSLKPGQILVIPQE